MLQDIVDRDPDDFISRMNQTDRKQINSSTGTMTERLSFDDFHEYQVNETSDVEDEFLEEIIEDVQSLLNDHDDPRIKDGYAQSLPFAAIKHGIRGLETQLQLIADQVTDPDLKQKLRNYANQLVEYGQDKPRHQVEVEDLDSPSPNGEVQPNEP